MNLNKPTEDEKRKRIVYIENKDLKDKIEAMTDIDTIKENIGAIYVRGGKGRGQEKSLNELEKVEIMNLYELGMSATEIAKKFNRNYHHIHSILNEERIKTFRAYRQQAMTTAIIESFSDHIEDFETMLGLYIEESKKPERVSSAQLPQLWSIIGTWIDKHIKMEELQIKKDEYELKKAELSGKANEDGLLKDLLDVMKQTEKND